MRVIKALLPSYYPTILCRLFNLCLSTGTSPPIWNSTDVHMVTNDTRRPQDADNVRPITLICMHRKLFERLLLLHFFDRSGLGEATPQPGRLSQRSLCPHQRCGGTSSALYWHRPLRCVCRPREGLRHGRPQPSLLPAISAWLPGQNPPLDIDLDVPRRTLPRPRQRPIIRLVPSYTRRITRIAYLAGCSSEEGCCSEGARGKEGSETARIDSRATSRQSRSLLRKQSAAQKPANSLPELVVNEPVEQLTTAKGRSVRRPARFRT